MMNKEITINLISEIITTDEIGNQIPVDRVKTVYATLESIRQTEFINAGQMGLRPEYKVVIWEFEYEGEKLVEIGSERYSVYRTYTSNDKIELYLTKRVGE
jgi:SPP1 family predicted phage head-tail adaptor